MELIYIYAGFLGVLVHCLIKAKGLSDDAKKANLHFNLMDYIKTDWFGIGLSFSSVLIWYIIFGEAVEKYPNLENFILTSFVGFGLFGSYLLQKIFSVGKKRINDVVDKKTNKADNK